MSLIQYQGTERRRESAVSPVTPTPVQLVVRCLAERRDNYWQIFSLEFGLAIQADTLPDAKRRLESAISSYVYDALVGDDREHARDLLNRKATWGVYLKYYLADIHLLVQNIWGASNDTVVFSRPLPLTPVCAS